MLRPSVCALLALGVPTWAGQGSADAPGLRVDPGPLAAALGAVAEVVEPPALAIAPWPRAPDGAAFAPEEWRAADWQRLGALYKAASAEPAAAAIRAELALAALASGRTEDAWRHGAKLPPSGLAAILPHFLPGAAAAAGPGGVARALPEGVVLRPALPPPTGQGGSPERARVELVGFEIADATVAVVVTVEGDGVELEFRHLGGPPVSFSAVVPCPPRLVMTVEYADWERQEGVGLARPLRLEPGSAPLRLWGRFERRRPAWPGHLPHPLPAQLAAYGLAFHLPEGSDWEAGHGLAGLAQLIGRTTGLPVSQAGPREDGATWPIGIHLVGEVARAEKVADLLGQLERFLLGDER